MSRFPIRDSTVLDFPSYSQAETLLAGKYLGTTVATQTYDNGGRLGTYTYANGAVVGFAYRNDNRPNSIATTHAGSSNIGTYSYTSDANKNRTGETITSTMSGFGFTTGTTGYDNEDRLNAEHYCPQGRRIGDEGVLG